MKPNVHDISVISLPTAHITASFRDVDMHSGAQLREVSRELTVKVSVTNLEHEQVPVFERPYIGCCELCGRNFGRSRFIITGFYGGTTHTISTCAQCTTMTLVDVKPKPEQA